MGVRAGHAASSFFAISEIETTRSLSAFGAALALGHVFTAVYWLATLRMPKHLSRISEAVCFPVLPSCEAWRIPSKEFWLLAPGKSFTIPLSLSLVYLFSALSKLRSDWLTGSV